MPARTRVLAVETPGSHVRGRSLCRWAILRILIDPSTCHCLNSGDLAMMLVAEQRIREFCPGAFIHMFTSAPELLKFFFPNGVPATAEFRAAWCQTHLLPGKFRQRLPDWLFRRVRDLEHTLWIAVPGPCTFAVGLKQWIRGQTRSDPSRFMAEVRSSDFIIVTGH